MTDLTFSYGLVDSNNEPIDSNDVLGPGDEFTLNVSVREDVAAEPGGIGSVILDIDFDESLVEPVGYSSSVINTVVWRTDFTQTTVGNAGGNLFLDNLGAGEPVSSLGKPGDGADVLFASIPFQVKSDIAASSVTSAAFTGQAYTSLGSSGGLIVNSLNAGAISTVDYGSISLNVQDPSTPPSISIAPANADQDEGDSGSTSFTFTVTRTGDTTAAGTVAYAVTGSGGNAANAADFAGNTLPSGTVSFTADQTSETVTIPVAGDTDFEADESFTITLSNASNGASIATATAGGTIRNDDPAPQADLEIKSFEVPSPLTVGSEASGRLVVENVGNTTSDSYTIRIYISPDNILDVGVDGDLLVLPMPLVRPGIGAGQTDTVIDFVDVPIDFTPGSYTVFATIDDTVGSDEREVASVPVEIVAAPTASYSIAADSAVKAEGDSGSTPFTFTVTRSGDTSAAGTVDFTVTGSGANAANASDFIGGAFPSGTVNFAANDTSKTITVNVNGDTDVEPDENFTVTLSNASDDATISIPTAVGTITQDDESGSPQQVISLERAEYSVAPGGTLSVDVNYETSDGDLTLAGIEFRLHYDSRELTFSEVTGILDNGFAVAEASLPQSDAVSDFDNNPNTNSFIAFSFSDTGGSFPGETLPASIATVTFAVSSEFDSTTVIAFSAPLEQTLTDDRTEFYGFSSTATAVSPQTVNLDVDDDGRVRANTDGLTILRYLLGQRGDDLVRSVFLGGGRTAPDEIAAFLDEAIDNMLDVDDDGRVRANTDGLTILRYLLGQRGDDLVRSVFLGGGRTNPEQIESFLDGFDPSTAALTAARPATPNTAVSEITAVADQYQWQPIAGEIQHADLEYTNIDSLDAKDTEPELAIPAADAVAHDKTVKSEGKESFWLEFSRQMTGGAATLFDEI